MAPILPLNSYQTSAVIVFPETNSSSNTIATLRSLYDKTYKAWPAHINILYPFVRPEQLQDAVRRIREGLNCDDEAPSKVTVTLDRASSFNHKDHATIYLAPSQESSLSLRQLRAKLTEILLTTVTSEDEMVYQPHLTIGQTSLDESALLGLLDKCQRLVANDRIQFDTGRILILQRTGKGTNENGEMKIVDEIVLDGWRPATGLKDDSEEDSLKTSSLNLQSLQISTKVSRFTTYQFSPLRGTYEPFTWSSTKGSWRRPISHLVVSTYNTLIDSPVPPPTERYPKLLSSILSSATLPSTHVSLTAHILCLQEVSDDFLSYLLLQPAIYTIFPYATHSATHGVLPSVRNCVTLSNCPLGSVEADGTSYWEWVGFGKRHKGAVVVEVDLSPDSKHGQQGEETKSIKRAIVANVHLTCGISDGSVAAKTSQLKCLTRYFENRRKGPQDSCNIQRESVGRVENLVNGVGAQEAWIIAGDLNITSSLSTISSAFSSRSISRETYNTLKRGIIPDTWVDTYHQTHLLNERSAEDLQFDGFDTYNSILFRGKSRVVTQDTIGDGEEGATFNPLTNSLAAERVKWGASPRPQRYDRVLLSYPSLSLFEVRQTGRFGLEGGSDHWGFWTHFQLTRHGESEQGREQNKFLDMESAIKIQIPDEELERYVRESGMWPTFGDYMLRENAKETLEKVFLGRFDTISGNIRRITAGTPQQSAEGTQNWTSSGVQIIIQPVGSYHMNVFSPSSDLDLLCASTMSAKTFWTLARQRIKLHGEKVGLRLHRVVEAHSGVMMELEYIQRTETLEVTDTYEECALNPECISEKASLRGAEPESSDSVTFPKLRIDLQYCQVPERILRSWTKLPSIPTSDPVFFLPITTLKKLNAYRDSSYLLQTIPNLKLFRLSYRALKLWALRRGIYSARFGYLGGIHLTLLLSRIFKRIDPIILMGLKAGQVLKLFFEDYAVFNYEENVYDPNFLGNRRYLRSNHREPIAITTMHIPAVNVAHAATKHTLMTLRSEFTRASQNFGEAAGWDSVTGQSGGEVVNEFLNSFGNFIKIDFQYWGTDISRGRSLVGWIESRCVLLLVELNAKLPQLYARMWPGRFISGNDEQSIDEIRGFYLIGLSSSTPANCNSLLQPSMDKLKEFNKQKKETYNKFMQVLISFESILRGRGERHGITEYYVSVTKVSRQALGEQVKSDNQIWWDQAFDEGGEDVFGEDYPEASEVRDDYDVAGPDTVTLELGSIAIDIDDEPYGPSLDRQRRTVNAQQIMLPPGVKLRPALDVMNRIKWDREINTDDYVIGYEDRFLGPREIEMTKWTKEPTAEEFIPMHRIIYFKKKSDGTVVWDREKKVDLLFGSGVGDVAKGAHEA